MPSYVDRHAHKFTFSEAVREIRCFATSYRYAVCYCCRGTSIRTSLTVPTTLVTAQCKALSDWLHHRALSFQEQPSASYALLTLLARVAAHGEAAGSSASPWQQNATDARWRARALARQARRVSLQVLSPHLEPISNSVAFIPKAMEVGALNLTSYPHTDTGSVNAPTKRPPAQVAAV
eukprot:6172791-Pleurochrysis_carterae.AAC.1